MKTELERLRELLTVLKQSRRPDGRIDQEVVLCPDSYRWMAEQVREYSDETNDWMALAASEFEKIADAMQAAEEEET